MRRGLSITIVPVLAGVFVGPLNVAAQSPTMVAVHAKLVANNFRLRLAPRVPDVEAAVGKRFANYLRERVGFLSFAVGDTVSPYRLVFELDRRERGSTADFEEFGFWVRLERPSDAPLELYWLPFRSADQSTAPIGTEEQFLAAVRAKLTHADPGPLRDSLLGRVPITQQALPHLSPPGWALTFRHLDLCIRNSSQLEFVNEIPANAMLIEKRFRAEVVAQFQVPPPPPAAAQPFLGGVFSQPTDPAVATELTRAMSQGPVRVKQVFVVSYRHDPNACRDRTDGPGAGGER